MQFFHQPDRPTLILSTQTLMQYIQVSKYWLQSDVQVNMYFFNVYYKIIKLAHLLPAAIFFSFLLSAFLELGARLQRVFKVQVYVIVCFLLCQIACMQVVLHICFTAITRFVYKSSQICKQRCSGTCYLVLFFKASLLSAYANHVHTDQKGNFVATCVPCDCE